MSTIYALCLDDNSTIGGVKKLYDLVDVLNFNQIRSFILHTNKGFRVDWFLNATNIIDFDSVNIQNEDLLILPEIWAERVLTLWPGIRKIIYCQNSFYTLTPFQFDLDKARKAYLHKDVIQIIVVSEYDAKILKWLFPDIRVSRIFHYIDKELFYYIPHKLKKIAVMPKKGWEDFLYIYSLLQAKQLLSDFSIQIIDNASHEECAQMLRESAIFLSFGSNEGFGLPPAEAMACGCIVIGYHGEGGKEFFKDDFTFTINQGDLVGFAECIHQVIGQFTMDPLKILEVGKLASEFIHDRYSMTKQESSILMAIKQFI